MNGTRILVVDDDPDIRGLVKELLERSGALVREASDGKEALRMLYDVRPELIVLDIAMPEMDGWQTLERIREMTDVPVVMLTAREGELEAVRGLKAGADDYVLGPLTAESIAAKVCEPAPLPPRAENVLTHGLLKLDREAYQVRAAGSPVPMRPNEFLLLAYFLEHRDRVVSRRELIGALYAAGEVAGMAGGHINGRAGLEGTMLGPSIFSGRVAGGWAAHAAGHGRGFVRKPNRS